MNTDEMKKWLVDLSFENYMAMECFSFYLNPFPWICSCRWTIVH